MITNKPELVLSGVLILNPSGRYTAYFEEFPDIVAEGDNETQAKDSLIETLLLVAQYKVKQRVNASTCHVATELCESEPRTVKHFHQTFGQLQAY